MDVRRNSADAQQSGHSPRTGPEINEVVPKIASQRGSLQDNRRGGELDPAVDTAFTARRILLFFLHR